MLILVSVLISALVVIVPAVVLIAIVRRIGRLVRAVITVSLVIKTSLVVVLIACNRMASIIKNELTNYNLIQGYRFIFESEFQFPVLVRSVSLFKKKTFFLQQGNFPF